MSTAIETIGNNVTAIAKEISRFIEGTEIRQDIARIEEKVNTLDIKPYGYNRLNGKVYGMLGDSTVKLGVASAQTNTSHYCWDIVARRNGMTYKRYGIGGTLISNYDSSGGDPSIVARYSEMDNDLDYIGVSAGYNDASRGIAFGELTSSNDKEFHGALNILCEGLIKKFIGKKIFFVTPWNNRTITDDKNDPYSEAIFNVASKRWGIPVLRADLASSIHPEFEEFRSVMMRTSSDTVHLGEKGHLAFADILESFMLTL